ncbi:MAG: alpha/beta fold hydrolase [Pseudomonadota bacterium]
MLALVAAALLSAGLTDPEAAFGRLPFIDDVEVSPSGERFAASYNSETGSGLLIYELTEDGFDNRLISESDNLKIRRYFWKRDDRLVFSAGVPSNRYGTPTLETRLLAVTPGEPDLDRLFKSPGRRSGEFPVQIQDRIVSVLPNDPEHILVEYTPVRSPNTSLYRVKVDRAGAHRLVQGARRDSRHFMTDNQGNVRARSGQSDDRRRLFVTTSEGELKDISHRVEEGQPRFYFAGFPSSPSKAFVLSDHATPTLALYVYNVDTDTFGDLLFSHPSSDVYGIRQRLSDGAAYGAFFAEDDWNIHYFGDNIIQDLTAHVRKSLDADEIGYRGMNPQETMAVFWAAQQGRPGQYYILDIANNQLTALPLLYPELESVALGEVIATRYAARDGLQIPAFVTLPPGLADLEAADQLPFVLLPHGGPNARDFSGFDWLAQYLAHKGYGVLQMNFRGSTGYGAEFTAAGDRQWGQAMQDDITDGARWLVNAGYADPERLAILGGSYGGYAALMGAVRTPDLFTCAVSINGVTSLPELISDAKDYIDGEYSTRHIGRLWRDRTMLRENSPRLHADKISVPVLLIAGEDDRVVRAKHSVRMHNAIRRAGGQSQLVELPEGNHYLNVGQNRITALRAIGGFMEQCQR